MVDPVSGRRRPLLALALAAALAGGVLTGCTGDGDPDPTVVQPGAPGEPGRVVTGAVTAPPAPGHTPADVRFLQLMIPHHQQALRMAGLVEARTARADIPLLAKRITISQQDEIALMRRWLEARHEKVPGTSGGQAGGHHGESTGPTGGPTSGPASGPATGGEAMPDMPGMLTEKQFAALDRARGTEFDRLFLTAMIYHHTGALRMVERLYADGGGQEPEIGRIAGDVDADQRIEIDRMQRLLADLGGPAEL